MTVPTGWRCPQCELVLAPSVAEHRCAPPSAGVTTAAPQPVPFTPTTGVTITAPYAVTATTGHLGVSTGYLTEVFPPRLEIAGGTAA
jgi:hypothetical protein